MSARRGTKRRPGAGRMSRGRWAGISVALAVGALASLVPTGPASALVGPSQFDTTDVAVGALLPSPPPAIPRVCGVTLVSSRVGILAGHCAAFRVNVLGNPNGTVAFSPDVSAALSGATLTGEPGTLVVDPAYDPRTDAHDLAAIIFAAPVAGVTPVALPKAGYLDGLAADTQLSGADARLVGYGTTEVSPGRVFTGAGVRRTGESTITSLTPRWLGTTAGPGQVTSCILDSGGPAFVGGVFTAVITLGDSACSSHTFAVRVDRPDDLSWIKGLIAANPGIS